MHPQASRNLRRAAVRRKAGRLRAFRLKHAKATEKGFRIGSQARARDVRASLAGEQRRMGEGIAGTRA